MESFQYLLFTQTNMLTTNELYERLLSVLVPGIEYPGFLNDNIIKNAIVVKTNLSDNEIFLELKEILSIIGYDGRFYLLKYINPI
jgi:hypothetical protein